jgi:hypothetical protein
MDADDAFIRMDRGKAAEYGSLRRCTFDKPHIGEQPEFF